MAWISNPAQSSDGRVTDTMNGPNLFASGVFSAQYTTMTTTSTSAWSLFSNQLAATAITNPLAGASAPTAVNLADGNLNRGPGSSLFLPGFGSKASVMSPMGAFTLGTTIRVRSVSLLTVGGTVLPHLYLRNATTGAVAYTLTAATTYSPTISAAGSVLEFYMTVISATQVNAYAVHTWGAPAAATALGGPTVPTTTTVDFSQDYYLDCSITMGTSGSYAQYSIIAELVG
jgi:hypothetical protein